MRRRSPAWSTDYERALPPGGWPNWVLGNHDQPRIAARVGAAQARIAAMLLLTLRGTPTMYYGDEIGLARVDIAPELHAGPVGKERAWARRQPRSIAHAACNGTRPRMPDFTSGTPWLPVDPNYPAQNVAQLSAGSHSILWLYRRLIDIRRTAPRAQHRRRPGDLRGCTMC